MDSMTSFGAGLGTGLVVMYVLIYLIPRLLPKSWFRTVFDQARRKRREEEARKSAVLGDVRGAGSVLETYKCLVTRNDIQRDSTISVRNRLLDLINDVRDQKRVRHLVQMVFVDWEGGKTPLWRDHELVKFVHEIYEQEPSLPFFLDAGSIIPVLELIYTAEKGQPPEYASSAPIGSLEEVHKRFVPEARRFFEEIIDDRAVADKIADACVERMEKAIRAGLKESVDQLGETVGVSRPHNLAPS